MTDASLLSKQSFIESISSPIIFGSAIGLFDYFYEKKNIEKCLYDSATMAGSLFISKIGHSVIDTKLIDEFGNNRATELSNYMVQPVINGLLYPYLYKTFYKSKFANIADPRTNNMSMILGASAGLSQRLSDEYIISWLTNSLNFN